MRRLWIILGTLILSRAAHAVPAVGSITFGSDTKQVYVSTTPTSPTQIMAATNFVSHTAIYNPTAANLYLSATNSTISTGTVTTGNFYVPPATVWSPDGPQDAYDGPMWAVLGGTSTTGGPAPIQSTVGVFRAK